MSDNKYNGWTNYATWRVNLEMFDDFDPYDYFSDNQKDMEDWLPNALQDYAEEIIFSEYRYDERRITSLIEDYARAFLQDVNWYEIASHLIEKFKE